MAFRRGANAISARRGEAANNGGYHLGSGRVFGVFSSGRNGRVRHARARRPRGGKRSCGADGALTGGGIRDAPSPSNPWPPEFSGYAMNIAFSIPVGRRVL